MFWDDPQHSQQLFSRRKLAQRSWKGYSFLGGFFVLQRHIFSITHRLYRLCVIQSSLFFTQITWQKLMLNWNRDVQGHRNGGVGGYTQSSLCDLWCRPYIVIIRTWAKYQQQGTPIRSHGWEETKSNNCSWIPIIKDQQGRFTTATHHYDDLCKASGVNVSL